MCTKARGYQRRKPLPQCDDYRSAAADMTATSATNTRLSFYFHLRFLRANRAPAFKHVSQFSLTMSRGRLHKSAEKTRGGPLPHTVTIENADDSLATTEEHERARAFVATPAHAHVKLAGETSTLPPALQEIMNAFQQQRNSQHLAFLIQQESFWEPHRQREVRYARLLQDAFTKASTAEASLEAMWERRLGDLRRRSDKEEQVLDKRLAKLSVNWMEAAGKMAERCRELGNRMIDRAVERLSCQLGELESTVDTAISVAGAAGEVEL